MIFRDRENGRYPITLDEVRAGALIVFGDEPPAEMLDAMGVDIVVEVAPPTAPDGKHPIPGPAVLVGNEWRQSWVLVDMIDGEDPAYVFQVAAVQGKVALFNAGLYETVEAALASHPNPLTRIWWSSGPVWRSDNEHIAAMAQALGMDEAQKRALFIAALAVPL